MGEEEWQDCIGRRIGSLRHKGSFGRSTLENIFQPVGCSGRPIEI